MWPLGGASLKPTQGDDISDAQIENLFSATDTKAAAASSSTSLNATSSLPAKDEQEPCSLQYYFDEFFMCYTPKSQLQNWYRYGEKKNCAERWKDFKWCMRTQMADKETAQGMLKRHQEELLEKVRAGPNSEDVWEIRDDPIQRPWNNDKIDGGASIT